MSMVFELTDHAAKRAQQRGISRDCIHLISRFADRRVRVPGGAIALSISDRARERCVAGGFPPNEVDRTRQVVLIADITSASIITVEHAHGRRRRLKR
jgi:hypothetical protein